MYATLSLHALVSVKKLITIDPRNNFKKKFDGKNLFRTFFYNKKH